MSQPNPPADQDLSESLADAVRLARLRGEALRVAGSSSKHFLGRPVAASPLFVDGHCGIVSYQPDELVITARAGTPLATLVDTLASHGQCLPFDPPRFGGGGTLGGAIATGLSGPARPFLGAARDFVLGVRLINGRGEQLRFGGEVMKNVAGYDVARLVTGAFGTLGVLLEVSLKVLPAARSVRTVTLSRSPREALSLFAELRGQALPLTGAAWLPDGRAWLRLAGNGAAVDAAADALRAQAGAVPVEDSVGERFWHRLRDHELEFFTQHSGALWRLSVPPASRPLDLQTPCLLDWAGGQRWVAGPLDPELVRREAGALGGHATRFRAPPDAPRSGAREETGGGAAPHIDDDAVFHPLPPTIMAVHRRLKIAFDPDRILNPGRQYVGV